MTPLLKDHFYVSCSSVLSLLYFNKQESAWVDVEVASILSYLSLQTSFSEGPAHLLLLICFSFSSTFWVSFDELWAEMKEIKLDLQIVGGFKNHVGRTRRRGNQTGCHPSTFTLKSSSSQTIRRLKGPGNMTALLDRGANLLVTVSPVARCYIFYYPVLYPSTVIKNLWMAAVRRIHKHDCVRACAYVHGRLPPTESNKVCWDKNNRPEWSWLCSGRSEEECEVRWSNAYLVSIIVKDSSDQKKAPLTFPTDDK